MILRALPILLVGPAAAAMELPVLDGATVTLSEMRAPADHRVATGPFDGVLPGVTVEGRVARQVWRVEGSEATPLALLAPLREHLEADGWDIVFACEDRDCGGFEFRFEIETAPAPQMFVDLGAYRYLAARKGEVWIDVVASRSGPMGYVQTTLVEPLPETKPDGEAAVPEEIQDVEEPSEARAEVAGDETSEADILLPAAPASRGTELTRDLVATGRAVLADLAFETGSTRLAGDAYPSLAELAAYLNANAEVTVAMVGHTDAEGGADANIALSRRRAESARSLLIERHGIAPGRVETRGLGYFAPLARNDTAAGREANRRVEVVVTSTG